MRGVRVSKEDIEIALREIGLRKGDVVGVHSSLSSFGYVEGGADTVIDTLLEVMGREGTIVMPTHSTNRVKVDLTPEMVDAGVLWLYNILRFPRRDSLFDWFSFQVPS